jgi:hypothetical protein
MNIKCSSAIIYIYIYIYIYIHIKSEWNKEHRYRGMNKRREGMDEDKKIEKVTNRRARGSS